MSHARTNRKDVIFMQRRLYIDEAHTALDIFRFAVFFYTRNVTYILTYVHMYIQTKLLRTTKKECNVVCEVWLL